MMSKNKIVPMKTSILSSPVATKYVEDHNKDLEIESELVRQMDNVVQHYTEKEDEMISSGISLLNGMKMKGRYLTKVRRGEGENNGPFITLTTTRHSTQNSKQSSLRPGYERAFTTLRMVTSTSRRNT